MSYSFLLNRKYTTAEFDRLFSDCLDSLKDSLEGTDESIKSFLQKSYENMQTISTVKDDNLIALIAISLNNGQVKYNYAMFGKDANNSRAYIYGDTWLNGIHSFLNDNGIIREKTYVGKNTKMINYHNTVHSSKPWTTTTNDLDNFDDAEWCSNDS